MDRPVTRACGLGILAFPVPAPAETRTAATTKAVSPTVIEASRDCFHLV
jgi:hypothetical protein